MAGTKNYFDQILENQNKLYSTLSDYLNQAMEITLPEAEVTEKAGQLLNEYFSRSYELAEKMSNKENMEKFQEDFWGNFTTNYTQSMELTVDLYKKTAEYWQNIWGQNTFAGQPDRVKRFSELFQNSVKAYMDTTNANAKAVQEYFNR